jgi:C4-dicarboxylate-specific signal transduction histidine kinase
LSVRDSGRAVAPAVLATLFRAPSESASGLGIGLYHAARQAEETGYRLQLAENRPGAVCFRLSGAT